MRRGFRVVKPPCRLTGAEKVDIAKASPSAKASLGPSASCSAATRRRWRPPSGTQTFERIGPLQQARTLVILGVETIDAAGARDTLHILLKYQTDIDRAAKELLSVS